MPHIDYSQTINNISFPSEFEPLKRDLNLIAKQIEECAKVIETRPLHIPSVLERKFLPIINEFQHILERLVLLRDKGDKQAWSSAQEELEKFVSLYYENNDGSHHRLAGSFFICQSILDIIKFLDTPKLEYDDTLKKLDELQLKSSVILEELQKKAQEEVATNYAEIFLQDAKDLKKAAYWWLGFIILLIGCFITFLIFEEQVIPLSESKITTIITLSYFRRLLIISFLIFVITFFIKQYNVKMHLYTQNKHRSNTLSSYKLFIQSMGDSDTEARSQLMREVSKSIYDAGHSGYLNLKDDGDNTSNTIINEITKIIKPSADK